MISFLIYYIIQNLMFKQILLFVIVAIIAIQSTIKVYQPQCAAKRLPTSIQYTLSNFGFIPYGQTILGQIILTQNENLCSTQNEKYIKKTDSSIKSILLVKRGDCKFTQKVINAQNLGADMIIIYDFQESDIPNVIMKNDGHGHLAQIPSIFISHTDGLKLQNTSNDCSLPLLKIEFQLQQRQKSQVILWLDANNRQTYILASQFYKNKYYKSIENFINLSIRFRVQTSCHALFCSKQDCYGTIIGQKYCRNLDKPSEQSPTGTQIIDEQLREYFLWQYLKSSNLDKLLWWRYMHQFDHELCLQKKDTKDCSYNTMKSIGIPDKAIESIEANFNVTITNVSNKMDSVLKVNVYDAQQLSIYFYPQATINNRNYYGLFKAPQVFQMICESLINPPKDCLTFIKNRQLVSTIDDNTGVWRTIWITLLIMTVGFIIALLVYTKIIRKQVDSQLSIEVNKMVQNYVDLGQKKKLGNSYSKFQQQK